MIACLGALLATGGGSLAQERPASAAEDIPERRIEALQQELHEAASSSSAIRKRRALKGVVRRGEALLEDYPLASGRFRVLEILLQSQKRLLGLESSDRNRLALFETCAELAAAPDELADLRLEADMLLSERELSRKGADVRVRAEALAELISRYRGTPGEAKSLLMASLIAPKLEAFELEKQILGALDERFAGDFDVIEWRREHHGYSHERVLFTGTYARTDGTSLTFPVDGLGHTCLLVFWSRETPDITAHLAGIQDLRARFPDHFVVFSLNVDELADGGEELLVASGLDWTTLLLPGGRSSQAYRVVARQDPIVVRVNAHGHAFLPSTLIDKLIEGKALEQDFDDPRYLAQLQSLLVGEFLVTTTCSRDESVRPGESVPRETLDTIHGCFTEAPLRYRLTRSQALSGFVKAEALCREAIARHPGATDLWIVRNIRIVALLGMWKLAFEPRHLEAAIAEARIALAASPPGEAHVVPRFCLAKDELRRGHRAPHLVLSELIEASCANEAPASAHAAAVVLTLDANAVDLHATYRARLLELYGAHEEDAALWAVVSFVLDQNHSYRLFKANYYMPPSLARRIERANLRSNAAALDRLSGFPSPLKAELDLLSGERLSLPQATDGKLTLLMFVEPPSDSEARFPTAINGAVQEDSRGGKTETKGAMQHAFDLAERHVGQGLQVIAAFLSEDRVRVRELVDEHEWPARVVLVPGGLRSPLVRRLGVLSADRVPNIVLLRPDGTIAWRLSGIVHPQLRSEGIHETLHVIHRAMYSNILAHEMERSLGAFERGDFEEAERLFSGPFPPPERPSPDEWTAPRLHGRALAAIELGRWDAALADLDAAIEAHEWVYNAKKTCFCDLVAKLRLTQATVLARSGRSQEAEEARQRAAEAKTSHGPSRAGRLHERLESLHGKGSEAGS